MPAIIGAGLVVEPEVVAQRVAVEKFGQIGGHQVAGPKSLRPIDQRCPHVPIGVASRVDAEVPAPEVKRLVKNPWQFVDVRRRWHGRIQRQAATFQLADASGSDLRFVDCSVVGAQGERTAADDYAAENYTAGER